MNMYNSKSARHSAMPSQRAKMEIISARIFARGNIWYLEYYAILDDKTQKRIQTSTKVKVNEKDRKFMVEKFMPAKVAQICQSAKIKELDKFEFGFWHDRFIASQRAKGIITLDKTITRSKAALEYFGKSKDVRVITRLDVKDYITQLNTVKKLDKSTLQSYLYQLSGILTMAYDDEIIAKNPAADVKIDVKKVKNKEAVKPFSIKEAMTLINVADGDLKYYLGIAFNTGMSPEEIIALMPQDIDFDKNLIKIRRVITKGEIRQETKTVYRTREIPLFESAKPYILEQMQNAKQKRSMFLFSKDDGARLDDIENLRGKSKNNTKWYGLLRKCGIEYRPMKNCRHTFAVEAIKSGKFTLQQIADILGHANLRMLIEHYADYIQGSAREANLGVNLFVQKTKFTDTFTDSSKIVV